MTPREAWYKWRADKPSLSVTSGMAFEAGYAAGVVAQREADALIVERWSLPTIQTPSMWLIDKAAIAKAIRTGAPSDGK